MSGAIRLLRLYAFVAWMGKTLPLLLLVMCSTPTSLAFTPLSDVVGDQVYGIIMSVSSYSSLYFKIITRF
jgi:hypothetical protein